MGDTAICCIGLRAAAHMRVLREGQRKLSRASFESKGNTQNLSRRPLAFAGAVSERYGSRAHGPAPWAKVANDAESGGRKS